MGDWNLQENREPPVCPVLVLAGAADMNMIPSGFPVFRKRLPDSLRGLCNHKKGTVCTAPYHIPGFCPPLVCSVDKEIRREAGVDYRPGRNTVTAFVWPGAVFPDRQIEAGSLMDICRILPIFLIAAEHIAVLASCTYLFTAMPQVPGDCYRRTLIISRDWSGDCL